MNRIYQGRVKRVELKNENNGFEAVAFSGGPSESDQSICPLWWHHQTFQDAVNYYLLAMASLAKEQVKGSGRLMSDLPVRIAEAWETFPRQDAARMGARSLRESVGPWLGLDKSATLEQAYKSILRDNTVGSRELSHCLALVLKECSGNSGIQQGGRGYLPKLCDSKSKATYEFSPSSIAALEGLEQLAHVLHGNPSNKDLQAIAKKMDLSWTVRVFPQKFYEGDDAIARLSQAISHVENMMSSPDDYPRLVEFLDNGTDWNKEIKRLKDAIKTQPADYKIARNKKAAPELTFSSIAFMAFPCQLTGYCLRLSVKAPGKQPKKSSADHVDFSALGDDPVKLSRGTRGYVFPAFTSLQLWDQASAGEPVWKEFDIAAFKEALKALNQFRLKTEEREDRKTNLEGLIAHLIGSSVEGWRPLKNESNEEGEIPDSLDSGLLKLAWELETEMTRGLSESVVGESISLRFGTGNIPVKEGGWTVTRASLRGFREIVEDWLKILKNPKAKQEELVQAVKTHQQKEGKARAIGSVGLFLTLCEPKFRPLWINVSSGHDEVEDESNRFLYQLAGLHESVNEYLRCNEPVNLTPAEPRHSRRAFMFSDLNGRSKKKYAGKDSVDSVEVSMARQSTKGVQEARYLLHFSSPRLHRDNLLGGKEGWLQPMTKALKLEEEEFTAFDSALSLMPDFNSSGSLRFLINFAVSINAEPLRSALGKSARWGRQFNGTKEKNIHLHWPGTIDKAKMKVGPWWDDPDIIKEGFTVFSTDLGQRTAGAWALLHVTTSKPTTRRPVRSIGSDGAREWFAEVLKTGMHRLPGEDALVRNKGNEKQELSGKRGRMASESEWDEAREIAVALSAAEPKSWVGQDHSEKSYPEQNSSLFALANRRLSRLGTFHRWSCFNPGKDSDPARRQSAIDKLAVELKHWEDPDVILLLADLNKGDIAAFKTTVGERFVTYRDALRPLLVQLANRACPLRKNVWVWKDRSDESPYGNLVLEPREDGEEPKVRGQRGLSMARVEQLEQLRKLFLRYNRSLDRSPGIPAKFGRADVGRTSGEPCVDLLQKIDHIKEQRVNQTAHLILAQALGVKLVPHVLDAVTRRDGDHHGEYAKISRREPVDLVVIENLDRYLTSQGRAPSENSRLMKWSHRAIRDKVKMLIEEPFGIPVLEVPASYSSRFCAVNSEPGSRCEERASLDKYLEEMLQRRADTRSSASHTDMRQFNSKLLEQFKRLDEINKERTKQGKPPKTLLLPKTGGPLFLGASHSPVVQSDINAAINLGFRAVAAPESLHLLHRVRSQNDGKKITTVVKNAREKAAYDRTGTVVKMKSGPSSKLSKSANFFYDVEGLAHFDKGEITVKGKTLAIASGIGIWHAVNESILPRIVAINEQRLGLRPLIDDKDELPM